MGLFYNTIGEKFSFLLLIMIILIRGRMTLNNGLLAGSIPFLFLVLIKSLLGMSFQPSDSYHSLWAQQVRIIEIAGTFFMLTSLRNDKTLFNDRILLKCRRVFEICYYSTISLTIIMLAIRGRTFYRDYPGEEEVIFAPQFFLFYAIIISAVLLSEIIRFRQRRIQNGIALLINGLFVFMMSYTTQMAFFFFTMVLITIFEIFKKRKALVLCIFCVIFMVLSAQTILPPLLLSIKQALFIENADVSMRLDELAAFFSSGDLSGEAFGGRIQVSMISWNTFLKHPLFGISFGEYNTGNSLVIGGHHEWIDDLARFGIIGFILFCIFIGVGFYAAVPVFKRKNSELNIVLIIIFSLYGFFNPFLEMALITAGFIGHMLVKTSEAARRKEHSKNHLKRNSILYRGNPILRITT